ncbi:carboxypeptidase-like regulatory domain-containing protein [Limibacter armeniacum]|uniref:carboxypeptidase-like regulatory domain-containing protein n=1 Tax=Limibacter armeniacum TaxID=466084 RepID=UPI002FE5C3FA
MKQLKRTLLFLSILMTSALIISCSDNDDDEGPTQGVVEGQVMSNEDSTPLEGVQVSVFDSDSNEPIGRTVKTDAEGNYSLDLNPGTYYLRLATLGYQEVPPLGVPAIPFTIVVGETVQLDYELVKSANQDVGAISGKIQGNGSALSGVLVIATSEDGTNAYSSISDQDGNYTIWNLPAGTYGVKGWLKAYNSENVSTSVTVVAIIEETDINMSAGANGSINGTVKYLATGNKDVDVSLIHPITQQVIPGLSISTSGAFTLEGIPDGSYLARASFNNDTLVVDPDFIVKFGDPVVAVEGGTTSVSQGTSIKDVLDFAVTNSVQLDNPTNSADEIVPVETNTTGLTFSWTPYSSASDYVVELQDLNGNVVWGGFDTSGEIPLKNITTTSTSITYDGPALTAGKIYRWKVYASKDDQKSAAGWNLISVSEDQMGLIRITE